MISEFSAQWRRYTRARQVKWLGWVEDPSPWLRPAYCFASVIVWTENKNVTISDRIICFILTVSGVVGLCFRATTRKGHQLFWGKKVHPRENPGYDPDSGWPGLRIFWPRNDLAPLLRWCRHCFGNEFKLCVWVFCYQRLWHTVKSLISNILGPRCVHSEP